MAGNRAQAEKEALALAELLIPTGRNRDMYKDMFAKMTDAEFEKWIAGLESGETDFALLMPNFSPESKAVTMDHLIKISRELGHDVSQRVWLQHDGGEPYLSNYSYVVLEQTIRRQAQIIGDKISLPKNNLSVDDLTGQATGASKGARLSYPELGILDSANLPNVILEAIKVRGGDAEAFRYYQDEIHATGDVSLETIMSLGTETEIKRTLSTLLTSMHLRNEM